MSPQTTPIAPHSLGTVPSYVTMDEAAQALAVSRDTIRRMIRRGDLDARKIGKSVRVTAESLATVGTPLAVAGAR
ncbi:helix-turn-helix domain-containing protein [Leucobacter massiliensis]|nr:helix-turn-helix domain-containing protein [Leucobacter massiliensis]